MKRLLIKIGALVYFIGCVLGIVLGVRHEAYLKQMEEITKKGNLVEFWEAMAKWKSATVAHAHILCLATLLLLAGLLLSELKGEKLKKIGGTILIIGVALSIIFNSLLLNFIPLMAIGEILVTVAVLFVFLSALNA